MRTILAAALLSGVVAGCASTPERSPEATTTGPTVEQTRTGLITAMRAQELQLFSPDVPESKTIWVARDESTEIVRDGQPIAWDELPEGAPVRVSFEPAAGAEIASRIEVLTGQEAEQVRSSLGQIPRSGTGGAGDSQMQDGDDGDDGEDGEDAQDSGGQANE
ncbi:MAG TPA: hypothetical protein DFS52_23905 [Myxococcales bacterium]|nr:hypothetical protein [Myxococcales bacterium]